MKKIFLAALLCSFSAICSYAEDIIQIKPVAMEKNVDIDADECGSMVLTLTSSRITEISGVGFEIDIPNQIVFESTDGPVVYKGDVLPSTTKKGVTTYKHTVSCERYADSEQTLANYTRYLVNIFSMSGDKFVEGEELISFDLGSKDEEGVFPIILKNMKLAISGTENVAVVPLSCSYVKVGAPTDASLKAEGVIPSLVSTELGSESAITSLDLSTATQINGTLDISSKGISALNETPVVAEGLKYTRSVGDDNFATVCLPFAVSGTYYSVSKVTESSITLTEATEIPACTPAIVKGDISASAENVTLSAPVEGNGLIGTYTKTTLASGAGYYIRKNKFYGDGATVNPYRAYIKSTGAGAKVLSVYVEDATGIHEITDQLSDEDIYTLQGIRVNKAQKGVNIIGGKKVYNK